MFRVRSLRGHSDDVFTVAFDRDSRQAFSASSDRTIRVWNVSSGEILRTFQSRPAELSNAALSRRGDSYSRELVKAS